jgi:hypothetical protein
MSAELYGDNSYFWTVATKSHTSQPEDLSNGKKVFSPANMITDTPCLTL